MPPHCFGTDLHALRMWVSGGLFRLWHPPPVLSRADKTSGLLCFFVWYQIDCFCDFCVRKPIVPGVSTRFFESLPFEGTFWP